MCRILGLSRQSYYYQSKPKKDESELEEVVAEEFIRSRKAYGSRKIKKALSKRGIQISRRKISRIMKNRGLKSSYTVAYFKVHHSTCNEAKTTNVLNRKFLRDNPLEAIVTGKKWNYVCFILDLFNREILCSIEKFSAILVENIKMPF
ncbi:hypothetical protein EfmJHP9_29620 (plasmid) [Enterococcus faecium]|nr:hypothetical protein EfmJHP9_29620 [Enterococcus faecium]